MTNYLQTRINRLTHLAIWKLLSSVLPLDEFHGKVLGGVRKILRTQIMSGKIQIETIEAVCELCDGFGTIVAPGCGERLILIEEIGESKRLIADDLRRSPGSVALCPKCNGAGRKPDLWDWGK